MTLPYPKHENLVTHTPDGVCTQSASKIQPTPELDPDYDHKYGHAWAEEINGVDAANVYRKINNLPLIELGDGR